MSTDDNCTLENTFTYTTDSETSQIKPTASPNPPDSSFSGEDKAIHHQVLLSRNASSVRLAFDGEKFRAKEVQRRLEKMLD